MTDFKIRLKNIVVSSLYANKIREKEPNKKFVKNNSVGYIIKNYNDKSDLLYINSSRNKQNNIRRPIKFKQQESYHRISLYKKYKKNNSKLKTISRNMIDDYKSENSSSSHFYDYSLSSRANKNNKLSFSKNSPHGIRKELSLLNNKPSNSLYSRINYHNKPSSHSKNTIRSNFSTLNNFKINKKKETINDYMKKNYNTYSNDLLNKFLINKGKHNLRRVEKKIINKIQLMENENKENKIKNLLINRPPIILNDKNFNLKFTLNDYNYLLPSSRYKKKEV
jgi:hypothetical protein